MIGIYKLVFAGLEDWPYVGQSRNINARYKAHCCTLARGIGNVKVLEAYEMCGEPTFEVLEECKEAELNTRERFWISKLDTIDNGLNNSPGGDIYFGSGVNHYNSKYSRDQIIQGMTLLQDPEKRLVDVAKESGMSTQALYSVKAGITHQWFQEEFPEIFLEAQVPRRRSGFDHHRSKFSKEQILAVWELLQNPKLSLHEIEEGSGVSVAQINGISKGRTHQWLQEEFPQEFIKIQSINRHLKCTYEDATVTLVSPDGQEFLTEGDGGTAFAKMIGESSAFGVGINSVISGKKRQYKGWTLLGNSLPTYIFKSPIDTLHVVYHKDLPKFTKEHKLHRTSVALLIKGSQKTTKGWSLIETK